MDRTIRRDANGAIKIRATVALTWHAWAGAATPEELASAINGQVSARQALTVDQVRRSMRDLGCPVAPGSNHYVKTHAYQPRSRAK